MQEPQIRQPSMSCKVDGPNKALYPFGHGLAYSQVGDSVGSLCGGLSNSEAFRNLSERKRESERERGRPPGERARRSRRGEREKDRERERDIGQRTGQAFHPFTPYKGLRVAYGGGRRRE